MADDIEKFLVEQDFVSMVRAMSGNGHHILIPIDLPNEQEMTELVKKFGGALDLRFSTSSVEVDPSTYNASRISKMYGTMACKGDSTTERPHRGSRILSVPDKVEPVSMELLQLVIDLCNQDNDIKQKNVKGRGASKYNIQKNNQSGKNLDIKEFCNNYGIEISHEKPLDDGICYVLSKCPWNDEHSVDKGAYIIQFSNGKIVVGCHHDSCRGESWKTLLKKFHAKRDFAEPNQENSSHAKRDFAEPYRRNSSEDTQGMGASDILMDDIMQSDQKFFHDQNEVVYVSVPLSNGNREYMVLQDNELYRCFSRCTIKDDLSVP